MIDINLERCLISSKFYYRTPYPSYFHGEFTFPCPAGVQIIANTYSRIFGRATYPFSDFGAEIVRHIINLFCEFPRVHMDRLRVGINLIGKSLEFRSHLAHIFTDFSSDGKCSSKSLIERIREL